MIGFAYFAILSWIPISLLVFSRTSRPRAVASCVVLGHLLLPQFSIEVPGPIDLSKVNAIALGIVIPLLLYDARRISVRAIGMLDLPMVVWCLCPLASSLANDLGPYDGVSEVLNACLAWGVPYLAGRMYFRTRADVAELCRVVVIGGLLYVPLCAYEIRMSPNLHFYVYGFSQHVFSQTLRMGGYRPMVFMQHGLAVGLWMCAATATAYVLTWGRREERVLGIRMDVAALVLAATALAVKSLGSVVLLVLWLGSLTLGRIARSRIPVVALILLAPTYLSLRVATDWAPQRAVDEVRGWLPGRAASLEARMSADRYIRDRAMKRPWFGWGGYNRFRGGRPGLPSDSMWAITLGQRGLVGLTALFALLALAPLAVARRLRPPQPTRDGQIALFAAVGLTTLFALDCLVNAMPNPTYVLALGALTTCRKAKPG